MDITSLHEQHFKAVDQKLDDIANQVAIIMAINKAHFAKLTNLMEQKFGTAIKIAERLIRTAYKNRLAPGALHHDVLLQIIDYIDEVAAKSELLSFVQPTLRSFSRGNFVHLQTRGKTFHFGPAHTSGRTTQFDALTQIHPVANGLQFLRQSFRHS